MIFKVLARGGGGGGGRECLTLRIRQQRNCGPLPMRHFIYSLNAIGTKPVFVNKFTNLQIRALVSCPLPRTVQEEDHQNDDRKLCILRPNS